MHRSRLWAELLFCRTVVGSALLKFVDNPQVIGAIFEISDVFESKMWFVFSSEYINCSKILLKKPPKPKKKNPSHLQTKICILPDTFIQIIMIVITMTTTMIIMTIIIIIVSK